APGVLVGNDNGVALFHGFQHVSQRASLGSNDTLRDRNPGFDLESVDFPYSRRRRRHGRLRFTCRVHAHGGEHLRLLCGGFFAHRSKLMTYLTVAVIKIKTIAQKAMLRAMVASVLR